MLQWVLCLSLALLSLATLTVAALGIYVGACIDKSMDEALLIQGGVDRTTRLYYLDEGGEYVELANDRISGYENALRCPLEEISPHLVNAFVAIEDKRFFEHGGIDWSRTASALLHYLKGSGAHFGGSTITQQLVKNLTGDSERSARRKIAELLRAAELEKRMTKNEILEQYLNVVNLAQNCYGVKTASNAYFSKEPSELSLREAACIAAITNNPSKYDPIRHPEANRRRRDLILSEMKKQGIIDEQGYLLATREQTELHLNKDALSGRVNSYYADMVVNDVIAALMRERGMSETAAGRLVYCGGLKIFTAMNPAFQEKISAFYENPDNFPTHEGGKKAQSALLLVNPTNGDILAVAGAIGKKESNRVQNFACDAKRPSGSVIKPLSVYAPALKNGMITWGTVFDDIPLSYRQNGAPWPRNAPNLYRGLTTVNTAITQSVNTVCVSVLERLGSSASLCFLKNELEFYSLDSKNDCGAAALALGQQHNGVSLREIVGGYTALANQGVFEGTRSFYRVLDSKGELLLENAPRERRVMDEADAAILTRMLCNVVKNGTAQSLSLDSDVEIAGKTGTTGKNCDKWFVGYTPELVCGVWYGHEYPKPLTDVKGNPALKVFECVMQEILESAPPKQTLFAVPDNVVAVRYCKDSGKLPSEACTLDPRGGRIEYGYFKKGTEPCTHCHCHVCVSYCEQGGVATSACPEESCYKIALLRVERQFPREIYVEDAPYTFVGAMPSIEQNFSSNEPYYANLYDSNRFFGIRPGILPYNRACTLHTESSFWQRRFDGENDTA